MIAANSRLVNPVKAKAAAGPTVTSRNAPRTGPPDREMIGGRWLSATATGSSFGRTSVGRRACIAGPPTTNPIPTTPADAITGHAPGSPSTPSTAMATASPPDPAAASSRPRISWRRGSPRSAWAPLSGANTSCGPNWAMVTAPTTSVEPVNW